MNPIPFLQDAQGWSDTTLLDLIISLMTEAEMSRMYKRLKKVAAEENAMCKDAAP